MPGIPGMPARGKTRKGATADTWLGFLNVMGIENEPASDQLEVPSEWIDRILREQNGATTAEDVVRHSQLLDVVSKVTRIRSQATLSLPLMQTMCRLHGHIAEPKSKRPRKRDRSG